MGCRGAEVFTPEAKDSLQIPRDALKHDRRDGDKGAVLHTRGENGVFLRKVESVAEGRITGLGPGSDDDVHLKEGVEDVDLLRGEVTLVEGRDLGDLGFVSPVKLRLSKVDIPVAVYLRPSRRVCCSTWHSSA